MVDPLATLPRKHYHLILADLPWQTVTWSGTTRTPSAKRLSDNASDHYPTLSLAEMQALPVSDLAADDALLAMWIISSHLDQALALADSWGFTFATDLFYWIKTKLINAEQIGLFTGDIAEPRISMGKYTRKQLEPCWLFRRGKGMPVLCHAQRQLIIEPPREHSRKPVAQYDRLHALFGDVPRLEMFARTTRAGWDVWGNEVGKFGDAAV